MLHGFSNINIQLCWTELEGFEKRTLSLYVKLLLLFFEETMEIILADKFERIVYELSAVVRSSLCFL